MFHVSCFMFHVHVHVHVVNWNPTLRPFVSVLRLCVYVCFVRRPGCVVHCSTPCLISRRVCCQITESGGLSTSSIKDWTRDFWMQKDPPVRRFVLTVWFAFLFVPFGISRGSVAVVVCWLFGVPPGELQSRV